MIARRLALELVAHVRSVGVDVSLGANWRLSITGPQNAMDDWLPVPQQHSVGIAAALAPVCESPALTADTPEGREAALDVIARFAALVARIEAFERAPMFDPVQALEVAAALAAVGGSPRRVPTVDEATELSHLIAAVAAAHGFHADQLEAARELAADQSDQASPATTPRTPRRHFISTRSRWR